MKQNAEQSGNRDSQTLVETLQPNPLGAMAQTTAVLPRLASKQSCSINWSTIALRRRAQRERSAKRG